MSAVRVSCLARQVGGVGSRSAEEAGCVVRDPFGGALDAPLDITTNISFACYANETLAARLIPIVREELGIHLGGV